MALTTFRHFCAAKRALEVYLNSSSSDLHAEALCGRLKEAVTLSLRTENVRVPDHQHRNRVYGTFRVCRNLSEMLLLALGVTDAAGDQKVMGNAADSHCLEFNRNQVYVCASHMEQWQREVTAYQSPVPILAAAWVRHCRSCGYEEALGMAGIHRSLAHSTLPGIHDKRLHDLIQSRDGTTGHLCDLHVHINGSTEFTPIWLYSLSHQEATCTALEQALKHSKKKVMFFHNQLRAHRQLFRDRLRKAALLRFWICCLLRSNVSGDALSLAEGDGPSFGAVAALLNGELHHEGLASRHPFEHTSIPAGSTDLQREGALWLHALWQLQDTKNPLLAVLMHVYMLFMHQHLRLLVQQPEQNGFDQFQYITLAGGREAAEAADTQGFEGRFRQFHGMYGPDLAHVEVRFSPKDSPEKIQKFLKKLWKDYLAVSGGLGEGVTPCPACPRIVEAYRIKNGELYPHAPLTPPPQKPFSLGLVAHFIKEEDNGKGPCRHGKLRDEIQKKAQALVRALAELRVSQPGLYRAVLGKDAASNELETPPEVFAPTFRYLNREGISHTTYHAGEDFEHVLCGIRAVYEAMYFLDLHSGDRIGHATALGIDPDQCETHDVYCTQGQWLDSLVWLTWLMHRTQELRTFGGEVTLFHETICRLYMAIYGDPCPQLSVLWKAWELRKYDVRQLDAKLITVHPHNIKEQEALQNEKNMAGDSLYKAACSELRKYHLKREAWKSVVTLPRDEQPSRALLQAVQDVVVLETRKKNLLVEVLPTSNVRISHYATTDEHHVMRWVDPENSRPAPQVVLGTDDPGIFSTTLRNEYSFILWKLQKMHPGCSEKPYEIVRHLIENGLSYRFMPEHVY